MILSNILERFSSINTHFLQLLCILTNQVFIYQMNLLIY